MATCQCSAMLDKSRKMDSLRAAQGHLASFNTHCSEVTSGCSSLPGLYESILGSSEDTTKYSTAFSELGNDLSSYSSIISDRINAKLSSLQAEYDSLAADDKQYHDEERERILNEEKLARARGILQYSR